MDLRQVLASAFILLIQHPLLFLPRLLLTAIWSLFWIQLAQGVANPAALTPQQAKRMLIFLGVIAPIQIWIYNAYFIIVKQYHKGSIDMVKGFKKGIRKLPEGMGAFMIAIGLALLLAGPAAFLFLIGRLTGNLMYQLIGGAVTVLLSLGIATLLYFTPASVVLGSDGFRQEFRNGYRLSRQNRRLVLSITVASFTLLAATTVLEGRLQAIGQIGFVIGRLLSSVISLYIMVMNPELLLSLEND